MSDVKPPADVSRVVNLQHASSNKDLHLDRVIKHHPPRSSPEGIPTHASQTVVF